jgi:drug/metabolite transporter (DMT)-like permease
VLTEVGLPLSATFLVLGAAVAHAAWNAIVHGIEDKLVALLQMSLGCSIVAVPLVLLSPMPRAESWPWLIASVIVHIAYQLLLMTSYRLGDFGQMYPIARGSSPLIVTGLAALFVHEAPLPLELAGVVVISIGLASLVFATGARLRPGNGKAIGAALATGLTIAVYTTIDGTGVRASGTATGYTGWLLLLSMLTMVAYALVRRGPVLLVQARRRRPWLGLAGGALSLVAYGLVLWAQTIGPLAAISALRETSIIVGAIIAAIVFKEGFGPRRIAATFIVFVGIVLINLA